MHPTDTAAPRRTMVAEIGLLAVVFIWAANFSITKATLDYVPPLAFTSLRFGIASVALIVLLRVLEPGVKTARSTFIRLSVLGIVGNSLYQPAFILGLHNTSATNSAVIIGSLPGVVALLAWISRIEKLTSLMMLGIATGLAGVFLVVGSNGVELGGSTKFGDLLTVVAVFCWAMYTLGLRKVDPAVSPLRVTTVTTVMGTPVLIALGIPESLGIDWQAVPPLARWGIVYSSLISLVVAYFFWNTGVRRIGASRSSIYSCLIPLAALVMAWAFLKESPRSVQLIGAALVVTGVLLTRKR